MLLPDARQDAIFCGKVTCRTAGTLDRQCISIKRDIRMNGESKIVSQPRNAMSSPVAVHGSCSQLVPGSDVLQCALSLIVLQKTSQLLQSPPFLSHSGNRATYWPTRSSTVES